MAASTDGGGGEGNLPSSDTETEESEKWRMLAAASFALITILVGVPLWWKTTEVYRVALPYDDLHSLCDLRTNLTIHVTVVVYDEETSAAELSSMNSKFNLQLSDKENNLDVLYHWVVRRPFEEEWKIFRASNSLTDLDANFFSSTDLQIIGAIEVVVLPAHNPLLSDAEFYTGQHRVLFMTMQKDVQRTFERISETVYKLVNPSSLQYIYDSILKRKQKMPDRISMRTLPYSFEVDVTFTLVLPEANLVDLHWDIEQAIQDYLEPFKRKISDVVKLNFKSQIFYLMFLDIRPHFNAERKHYVLPSERLPHVVNPVEAKLGSYVSMNPSLNFVVYVPAEYQSPLQVYGEDGEPSRYNSFLIPRWGGFHVHNVDHKDVAASNATIDMHYVFGVFVAQMRILLGIHKQTADSSSKTANYDDTYLHDWEVDNLMRARNVENLANSASTLKSLAQLLDQISNIVISDHVGEQIYRSVNAVFANCEAMQRGDLGTAFLHSKEAFSASETAFFDPSMLSLLYFPEDQKYAVYMPLFLPISVPLLLSLIPLAKWLMKKRTKLRELAREREKME